MSVTVFSAPSGTIRELLTNLGITDQEAVNTIHINSTGNIEVEMKARDSSGAGFAMHREILSDLPFVVTYTVNFVEEAETEADPSTLDTYVIRAYNTQSANNELDILTEREAYKYTLVTDEGERGKLRTFTYKRMAGI